MLTPDYCFNTDEYKLEVFSNIHNKLKKITKNIEVIYFSLLITYTFGIVVLDRNE
jgi:hypothetical protein